MRQKLRQRKKGLRLRRPRELLAKRLSAQKGNALKQKKRKDYASKLRRRLSVRGWRLKRRRESLVKRQNEQRGNASKPKKQ